MDARRAAAPEEIIEEIEPTLPARRARNFRVRAIVVPLALAAVTGILGAALTLPGTANQAEPLPRPATSTEVTPSASASMPSVSPSPSASPSSTQTPSPSPSPSASASASASPSASPSASASASPTTSASAAASPSPSATAKKTVKATPSPSATAAKKAAPQQEKATPKPKKSTAKPGKATPKPAKATPKPEKATPKPEKTTPKVEKKAEKTASKPKKASTAKPSPSPKVPALGTDATTLYTTDSVHARTGPGKDYDSLTVLRAGAKITATDVVVDGWQQINRKGTAGWIKASLLSSTEPVAESPKKDSEPKAKDKKSKKEKAKAKAKDEKPEAKSKAKAKSKKAEEKPKPKSDARCSKAGDLESKLTSRTVGVLRAVCAKFPDVSSYGGYRPGDRGYHGSGRAIDVMISGEAGWEIAKWARSNASDLGVVEVIYEQKIWTTQRSGDGWRSMSDRGSTSANHYDHVHLSVR